jgi:uncharacterized protein
MIVKNKYPIYPNKLFTPLEKTHMPTTKRQLKPVPFTQVRFDDAFWAPRMETNRKITLPHIYKMLEETGRIAAFDLNFEREVPSQIVLIFGDSDPAKWIEAASYSLATHPDPELEELVNQVTEKIISAQQPDGYLNTHFTHTQPEMRWKNVRDWHEMYCAGHLIEGAVAHFQATGQRRFLDALCRYADHIDSTFGAEEGKLRGYPGHPELELALMRLYHATGNQRYLDLASFMIDERGQVTPERPHFYDVEALARGEDPRRFWARSYEYNQSHLPIREQDKVVGHAVRAMYLFSAVADLADEKDDATLLETCNRLWDNLTNRRMYLTGGIGPSHQNEGFTSDYDLPDETAYAETCATIALVQWNQRLLQFAGEGRFADVLERGLYNGLISGISLSGDRYLYENPLSTNGTRHRQEWFICPCCPGNLSRTVASVGNLLYSTSADGIWAHLFAGSTAQMDVLHGSEAVQVEIRQETLYPWDGAVKFTLTPAQAATFTLHLRVPGWCESFQVAVNGNILDAQPEANGYLALTREWAPGDVVAYTMDMPVKAVYANENVRQLVGRVAIQRGPIVYCLEGVDNGSIMLDRISVDAAQIANFSVEYQPNLLGGVSLIRGKGMRLENSIEGDALYHSNPPSQSEVEITAIPYCVWDNRAPGEMRVWIREN